MTVVLDGRSSTTLLERPGEHSGLDVSSSPKHCSPKTSKLFQEPQLGSPPISAGAEMKYDADWNFQLEGPAAAGEPERHH